MTVCLSVCVSVSMCQWRQIHVTVFSSSFLWKAIELRQSTVGVLVLAAAEKQLSRWKVVVFLCAATMNGRLMGKFKHHLTGIGNEIKYRQRQSSLQATPIKTSNVKRQMIKEHLWNENSKAPKRNKQTKNLKGNK